MLTAQQRQRASDTLWEHWQQGRALQSLPPEIRPTTREDGYTVQRLLEQRTSGALFGWKLAATSEAGQQHVGVDGPMAGRLLRERVFESGAQLPYGVMRMKAAEPEFAFRMGRDLPPRQAPYVVADVLAAVETLHPAIEVPDSRYEDFAKVGAAQLIADNACAHYFVLGAATRADWRARNLAEHVVTCSVTGKERHAGKGANVLGDPRTALTWLANELSRLGIALGAGQVVTTGTCLLPLSVEPGDHVVADFGDFGSVEMRFAR